MRMSIIISAFVAMTMATAQAQTPGRAARSDLAGRLAAMDVDGDGRITHDEAVTARARIFRKLDANGDGLVEASEAGADRSGRRVMAADSNRDEKVTSQEWSAAPFPLFDRFDANKDGVLDRDELAKARDLAQQFRQGTP